jgi:UDP-glucose 4-epimerase
LGNAKNLDIAKFKFPEIEFLHIDASSESSLRSICESYQIDTVFNLAVVPLPTSLQYPSWTSRVNFEIVLSLCELARTGMINELIHFSSSEAYGSARYIPMDEKHPLNATTPYAASKAAGDLVVNSYIETFQINAKVVRPFNNYGPRQNKGSYAGIIPIVSKQLQNGTPITIHGTGNQTRDFVYAATTADLAIKVAKTEAARGLTLNLATGIETSILQLIEMMKKVAEKPNHPINFAGRCS